MEKSQENQLNALLDQLYLESATYIRWDYLYHWYKVERIAKGPWRDIKGRWEELCAKAGIKKAPELTVLHLDTGATITRGPFENEEAVRLAKLAE